MKLFLLKTIASLGFRAIALSIQNDRNSDISDYITDRISQLLLPGTGLKNRLLRRLVKERSGELIEMISKEKLPELIHAIALSGKAPEIVQSLGTVGDAGELGALLNGAIDGRSGIEGTYGGGCATGQCPVK
jgi:hypothetical protein